MKRVVCVLLFTMVLGCKEQPLVFDMYSDYGEKTHNAYYKDTQNFLNQYVGTWIYTQGNTQLKIVFQKKPMMYIGGNPPNYYEDYLVGEYRYVENGVEKVNTLSNLMINHSRAYKYNIEGNIQQKKGDYPKCPECAPEEKRLFMFFNEPDRRDVVDLEGFMVLRRFVENGVVKLKIWFGPDSSPMGFRENGEPTTIDRFTIPYGEYILVKQP